MADAQLLILLLLAIAVLAGLARLLDLPYPVVLVLGGLGIALVPGAPRIRMDPDLVFLIFLPLLLYSAAFLSSARELRAQAGPILLLAVGLVLVTMGAVAAVAHLALGIPWAPAFVLGAVLGPTDPISATSILARVGAPRRISTILEGESLVNDSTALVSYKIALGAVGAAGFSAAAALGPFVLDSAGGAAVGLAIGWLSARVRRSLDESQIEITVSLLTPFAAYIPAEQLGLSGVLAAVAAGLYVGEQSTGIISAESRLRASAFWEVLAFLLNSVLFLLIGLELPTVLGGLTSIPAPELIADAALVSGVVVAVRLAWSFALAPVSKAVRRPLALPSWRERVVVGWSGMRGAVSLAAVLAIPLTVGGEAFPHRDLIVFVTSAVVVATLVPPGLTLGPLIERLGLAAGERERAARHHAEARASLARAALARLDELAEEEAAPVDSLDRLRSRYDDRLRRLEAKLDGGSTAEGDLGVNVRRELLAAERGALADLRREGEMPDRLARAIERDLDLEEARLHG